MGKESILKTNTKKQEKPLRGREENKWQTNSLLKKLTTMVIDSIAQKKKIDTSN